MFDGISFLHYNKNLSHLKWHCTIASGCPLVMSVAVDLCNGAVKSIANVEVLSSHISYLDVVGKGLSLILGCHLSVYVCMYVFIYLSVFLLCMQFLF